jgi:hypothetical protein
LAIVLEDCTTEEQHSVVGFCGQKDSMQRIFIKKCFRTVGSVCQVKWFHLGSKRFADDELVQREAQKWQIQQSEDFCVVGFDALVKL